MEKIKLIIKSYYVKFRSIGIVRKYTNFILLLINFIHDLRLYAKYSLVFKKDDIKNKEADLILQYHALEKGMLFDNMRMGFAKHRIDRLHKILSDKDVGANIGRSQIRIGYQTMCKYYELHEEKGFDISQYYTHEQYIYYRNMLKEYYDINFKGIHRWKKEEFYKEVTQKGFDEFAHSRQSIRHFTGEKIDLKTIRYAIELANTSPSVCNRQASNVYLVEDKKTLDQLLKAQGGFAGYSQNVSQLLIVTNDRKYYYTVGERNQFYIDGGLYLMNLLYSLHFYNIANCPANWGKTKSQESRISPYINIPKSEKIICMIPIGIATKEFNTTLSKRRPSSENLYIV